MPGSSTAPNRLLALGRRHGSALIVGGIGLTTLASVAFLPHQFWPRCPIYSLTGIYCPGCGGLRATWDLLHGNIQAAVNQNALIFAIPLFVLTGFVVQWDAKKTGRKWPTIVLLAVTAVVAIGFTWLRNLPGSWLAPDPLS